MKKGLFLILILILFLVYSWVLAGYRPPFGGEYTNLCGSGTEATFYNCPAICNIDEGWCETRRNEFILINKCDGKVSDCNEDLEGPRIGRVYLTSFANVGSNKTVKISVYRTVCYDCPEPNELRGYMVWYSGGPNQIECHPENVIMDVYPNPARVRENVFFNFYTPNILSWWNDVFSGGVNNCIDINNGFEKRCQANQVGTFTWTRYWKECINDNCSPVCSKSINFSIEATLPNVITLPPVETL